MAGLGHVWTDVFQAAGTTLDWFWPVGEREHYWGYSFRPWQANSDAIILQQWTTTDNDLRHTEFFTVRTNTGNLFRLSAIVVSGT